ncbi:MULTISPECIES: hypothetical protein [unclassified Leptolyngbya]|uniref:hypothetical protein n=1 Tax=unclassified Leptolyngbya TaxID=2650499 RepID=UPI0016820988|nr:MULTISPECIES: hypothetical protein [unclassified Leptolyngbya]MBD1913976.1 hypothetical protein [Leptolyngbya sp. FACHB-8]MBD2155943.1 hypothetical protein [Leptolyngbya sp. FACHB-16]
MTDPQSTIRFEVVVPAHHTALLEGLALWQQLGLLSDEQVRQLCHRHLTCPLPSPQAIAPPSPVGNFVEPTAANRQRAVAPRSVAEPGWLTQRLQALMEEISIIWLLFLGVFLVIVSSGVLAASQWQNFSPTGQYLVLLAYSVAFFAATAWTARRPTLKLTTQMVQMATLLLIPINFWRMDTIALWQQPWGWAIAPLAALMLSAMLVTLLRPTIEPPAQPRWVIATIVALSWLHGGWAIAGMALIASYGATIGSALTLTAQFPPTTSQEGEPPTGSGLSQPIIVILLSLLILLVRALWVAQVPFSQLGLAFGICGGLLAWQSRRVPARRLWMQLGIALLLLGWGVTVGAQPPLQAIAVSLIGVGLILEQLLHTQRREDLASLFLVGLQAYWLMGRVIPPETRRGIFAWLVQQAGPAGMPWAALGVSMFPYLIGTLLVGNWYYRQSQRSLGRTAEHLALALGVGLVVVSLPNPLMRSLTLSLAFLTLIVTVRRREELPGWVIYGAQFLGLGAIAAWVALAFPTLSYTTWSLLLLGAALVEWGFCLSPGWSRVHQSSWHLGLGLASLGGLMFWNEAVLQPWGWLWLAVPLALTGLAYLPTFPPYRTAIGCSTAAAVLVQALTYETWETRLFSLGLMTGLLLFNTRRQSVGLNATTHIGLGLLFVGALFWQVREQVAPEWPVVLPLMIAALWGLWHWQSRKENPLSRVYKPSLTGWAIALSIGTFIVLYGFIFYTIAEQVPLSRQVTAGIVLLIAAIAYRLWLAPRNPGFYSLAIAVEMLLLALIHNLQPTAPLDGQMWAIANLALGLGTQIAGDFWTARKSRPYRQSWHLIPLSYGAAGIIIGHGQPFSPATGLYTLAAALIGLGVGRRRPRLKPVTFGAMLLITAGFYELLIYQLSQASGGAAGDGLVLLAGLAAVLGVGDRLLSRWIGPYLRLTHDEFKSFALGHWVLGSGLLLMALSFDRSLQGGLLWISVALILAADALWQGRTQENLTYAGITAATVACGYGLWLAVPDTALLLAWAGAIATPVACAMYLVPWPRLGWSDRPWQNSALILPLTLVVLFADQAAAPSLFIVGAFYAWVAKVRHQVRLSYFSVLLANWGVFQWLNEQGIQEPLAYASLIGLSLLYLAQVDPNLQTANSRQNRHWLRILAVGLIVLTSIYEAERGLGMAGFALAIALLLVIAGLAFRVRAYLFVGTLAFIYQVLRQLVVLIDLYPLLLWAVGIALGLLFIWIAANFEARRAQIAEFVRYWLGALEQWD